MKNGRMKSKKRVWFVVGGLIGVMLATGVCAAKEVELLMGGTFDVTGVLTQGSIAIGWEDYIKYINEVKGGINGAKVVLRWADDQYKADKTISWYNSVMGRKPEPLMFCPQHTTGGIALKKLMEKDAISGLSFSCAGAIVYPPATEYTLTPTYQDQVAMFFDWILMNWKEKRKPRFGWISPDNPFGRDGAKPEIKAYAEKVGIEIVGEEFVPPVPIDTTLNARRLIKEKKADFVWTNGDANTLIPVLRDAERIGLRKKVVWGSVTFVDFPDVFRAGKKDPTVAKAAEGLFISFIYPQWEEVESPSVKFLMDLSKKYQGGLPREEGRGRYIHGVVEGIVTEQILRLVAEKVPVEKITKDDIEKYGWWRMKDYDPMGFLGGATLTYGKDLPRCGVMSGGGTYPLQVSGGKLIRLKERLKPHGLP
jgi:ABC-type branched-subunit amino acid transport system substrate-binding protein